MGNITIGSTWKIPNFRRGQPQGVSLASNALKCVGFLLLSREPDYNMCGAHALVGRSPPGATSLVPGGPKSRRGCTSTMLASQGDGNSGLERPLLQLITPDGCASSSFHQLIKNVKCAIAGGVALVQLRDNISDADSKSRLARLLRDVTLGSALFVINGDISEACSCGADGVHLPERMIDRIASLRGRNAWPRIVGCSVHSVEAAARAARLGVDYVQVGTMFTTQSHPGKEPEGVGLLRAVRQQLQDEGLGHVSVIGVGGINADNCGAVASAGADGVAAIRCLCEASDPEREARQIVQELQRSMSPKETMPSPGT